MSITITTTEMKINLLEDITIKNENNASYCTDQVYFDIDPATIKIYQRFSEFKGAPVGLISADLILYVDDNIMLRMNVQEYVSASGLLMGRDSQFCLLERGGFLARLGRYFLALNQAGLLPNISSAEETHAAVRKALSAAYKLACDNAPALAEIPDEFVISDVAIR